MFRNINNKLIKGFNIFKQTERQTENIPPEDLGSSLSNMGGGRPHIMSGPITNDRSIVASLYMRLAIDVASAEIAHAKVDDYGKLEDRIDSGLQECLNVAANIDQTGRSFIQDVAMSLFEEGVIAIVPVDTKYSLKETATTEIYSLRVGTIEEWFPRYVKVSVYDDETGVFRSMIIPKTDVAIVTNPFYNVMNEPNSTLKRLVNKLNLLDRIDEQTGSGKMDLLIKLPYALRTQVFKDRAKQRMDELESQLRDRKYGIGFLDVQEQAIQLNRPVDNNLVEQISELTSMLYSQLGLTKGVFEGTASNEEMLNYHNRTIEPILAAIVDSMIVTFLTKTARTQGQSIVFYRDPFKLVPVEQLAEIADKFSRNEIMSSNEFRSVIGMKPSKDPAADELRNKNINKAKEDGNGQNGSKSEEEGIDEESKKKKRE